MTRPIVLVVDDEEDIRESLTTYLRRALEGVGVVAAENAHDAIQMLRLGHVDLILTDQFMPEGNGTEVLEYAWLNNPKTTRMLMTAFPESDVLLEACNKAHVQHIFTKPLEPRDVAAAISAALETADRYPERRRDPLMSPSR